MKSFMKSPFVVTNQTIFATFKSGDASARAHVPRVQLRKIPLLYIDSHWADRAEI